MTEDDAYRLEKLKELLAPYGGNHRDFCRAYPDVDPNQIYQWLNDDKRNMGEKAARNLARKIGMPGYFDRQPKGITPQKSLLLAAVSGFTDDQIAQLIKVAGWVEQGLGVSITQAAASPPNAITQQEPSPTVAIDTASKMKESERVLDMSYGEEVLHLNKDYQINLKDKEIKQIRAKKAAPADGANKEKQKPNKKW